MNTPCALKTIIVALTDALRKHYNHNKGSALCEASKAKLDSLTLMTESLMNLRNLPGVKQK